jgi:hypothetical protein
MGPGATQMESEQKLIDGFLSREPAAETALVVEVQRLVRARIRGRVPHLWSRVGDIQQDVVLRLCEMRENPKEVERIQPPLWELVLSLMEAPVRAQKRMKKWVELTEEDHPKLAPNQEEALELKELQAIAESLPRGAVKTMLAHEAEVTGDGPPLAEALGTDARSARKRLARAQAAVIRTALGEGVQLEEENDDE